MPSRVVCIHCPDYDPARVEAAITRGLDLLGPATAWARRRLLLKPNLLAADPPERCTTTHPIVFQGVANYLLRAGAQLHYGDSPAVHKPKTAAEKSGIAAIARELAIPLDDFETRVERVFSEGLQNKRFILAQAAAEHIGAIVNLPKFKTHGLTRMTGAVKNLFGCVPGILKSEFHVKLPDAFRFSQMLVDLNRLLNPCLHVMDGIMAMEGNGPRSGQPYPLGILLFATDPVALDATAARIIGMDPEIIPTVVYGGEQGLGRWHADEIEVIGDAWEPFRAKRFQATRRPIDPPTTDSRIAGWLKQWLVPKPKIRPSLCTRCGTCVAICPVEPKALQWFQGNHQRPPVYDYQKCIRCYCCQELCPEKAIAIRTPWLRRWLP